MDAKRDASVPSSVGCRPVAHLLSPEGILVGIVYTPWMHKSGEGSP
jgi:hypothetical protein